MNILRVPEEILKKQTIDPDLVATICAKQQPKKGFVHISDDVMNFFEMMYLNIARVQSLQMIHICHQSLLKMTKAMLYKDTECLTAWFKLFEGCEELAACEYFMDSSFDGEQCSEECYDMHTSQSENDLMDSILLHLYNKVVSYFCKVHFSELVKTFKECSGKKKSQPIRTHLTAMENVDEHSKDKKVKYPCSVCNKECKSYFTTYEESSVQCSMCNIWFHFPCARIKGTEECVQKGSTLEWYCKRCKEEHEITNEVTPYNKRSGRKGKSKNGTGNDKTISTVKDSNGSNNVGRGRGRIRGRSRGRGRGRGRGMGRGTDTQTSILNDNSVGNSVQVSETHENTS